MKNPIMAAALSLPFGAALARAQEAQEAAEQVGIDQAISDAVAPFVNPIVSTVFYSVPLFGTDFPLIVGWLLGTPLLPTGAPT